MGSRGEGQAIVLGEIARARALLAECFFEAARGLLGDVFIEGAWARTGGEDALDGVVFERAEGRGVPERGVDVGGGIALAQEEDLARLVAPEPRHAEEHQSKERGGLLAHARECNVELLEIEWTLSLWLGMKTRRIELQSLAATNELVARDASQIGGIDEELVLGNAQGKNVCDLVVGDSVAVSIPVDEAVDSADAIDDASGVVGMARERDELLLLLGKALEGIALVA